MSKLADAIRRTQRVESAPMGFGASRSASPPTMLVAALVDAGGVAEAVTAGADVVIVNATGALTADGVTKAREAAGDAVLGAMATVDNSEAAQELKGAGLDFLIVSESTPAAALLEDDLGYTLAMPSQPDEIFLRSLAPLSFEALYLLETPSPLTVSGQIALSRVAALAGKPLLTRAPGSASKDDLRCLRSVGVAALVTDAAGVASLKETVKSLPPRRGKREDRAVVSLPHGTVGGHDHDDDDDDD